LIENRWGPRFETCNCLIRRLGPRVRLFGKCLELMAWLVGARWVRVGILGSRRECCKSCLPRRDLRFGFRRCRVVGRERKGSAGVVGRISVGQN
jgi:hypothetical protein